MLLCELLILLFLVGSLFGSISERLEYNNGICKKNELQWKYFDTDSQGGRGYKAGDQICWVSWPMIDK